MPGFRLVQFRHLALLPLMPLFTPPLEYISITTAITSTNTPAVTWIVRLGSRMRAGITSTAHTDPRLQTLAAGLLKPGDLAVLIGVGGPPGEPIRAEFHAAIHAMLAPFAQQPFAVAGRRPV